MEAIMKNKLNIGEAIRQGDVALVAVSELPEGSKASKDKVLLAVGSGGNAHSFSGGAFYPKQDGDYILGYLKAKGTKLFHAEHNPKGDAIPDGVYEVRKQFEKTPGGMKPVID